MTTGRSADIFLVEDDLLIGEFVTLSLGAAGYEVRWAKSGPEALAQLAQSSPDLMLLDLSLPGLDGFGVLTELKAQRSQSGASAPRFPVILMTGQDTPEVVKRALTLGATGYLAKPFGPSQLIERVGEQLAMAVGRN